MGKKIRYGAETRAESDSDHEQTRRYVIPIASKPTGLPHPRLVRRLARGTAAPAMSGHDDFVAEATTNRLD